ncbi:MAG TPA: OsmC family peroxiredoxin [Gaiellaceae bacterium]
MPRVERTSAATWEGNVARGGGAITAASGAFGDLPYSLATRIGNPEGKTSPEELLAAAHAACFAMSLAGELAGNGTVAEKVEVTALVTLDQVEDGSHRIVSSQIDARARVTGVSEGDLRATAEAASKGCPLSALIEASAAVTVKATLEGGTDGD